MQRDLNQEKIKRTQIENQVGNIPEKLNEYEMQLRQLIKDSGQKLEMVTSNLCVAAANLGKKSNEEIMSPDAIVTKILSGSRKERRKWLLRRLVLLWKTAFRVQ